MKTTTQSVLPNSAPYAKPEPHKRNRLLNSLFIAIWQGMRRVLAVARCEILLQTRSIVSWVMLAAFTLLTVLNARSQVSTDTNYVSNGQAAVAICAYAVSFIFFLLPFLHFNTFARDRQRRMHQLIWTRSLASLEYALGKGLGAIVISLLLSWLPLFAGWLTVSVVRGAMQPVELWFQLLLVVSAGTVLVTLVALLCIALTTPVGLLGALLTAGAVVYVDVIFAKSMLFLNNLTATTLFTSASIGLGPDNTLILWQRLTYVMGGLCCLSLLALVYQLRERLGVVQLRHIISTALLIVLTGGALFASLSTYQSVGAAYTDPGILTTSPAHATTSNYSIDVSADPASGNVQGTASFTLTPQGNMGSSLIVELNPGLHIHQIEAQPLAGGSTQTLAFAETSPGWTRINLAGTNTGNGLPLHLTIQYAGYMLFSRDDYAAPTGGYGRSNGISWSQDYFYLSYLGQGVGELLGAAGSWYPMPLTQQALDAGTRIPVDDIRLRFPSSFKVWSSLGTPTHTADGNWQELDAHPHAGLPEALVAALSNAQQGNVNGLPFWYQGDAPDQTELLTYKMSILEARAMNLWLAPNSMPTSFQTVVEPILPFPVIGPGLLLLPETQGANGLDPISGSPYTPTVIARVTASQLAQSWWLSGAWFPFTPLSGGSDTQNPNPSTSIGPTSALLDMLSQYSAVVITDKAIGSNFFAKEMQLCSREYTLTISASSDGADSQEAQILQQEMATFGTTCSSMELVPYRLSLTKGVGFTRLTGFLQKYALSHALQQTDMRQFLQQASKLAGINIIPEAAPYICPAGGKTTPANGAPDPLTCLNQNYSGT